PINQHQCMHHDTVSTLFPYALYIVVVFFFFFQAEDGIRDKLVTGVQTCALPIFSFTLPSRFTSIVKGIPSTPKRSARGFFQPRRSEERRVGKECRSRWARE